MVINRGVVITTHASVTASRQPNSPNRSTLTSRRTLIGLAPVLCTPSPLGGMCKCARCGVYDKYFAFNMAFGMQDYEAAIAPHKATLFSKLFSALDPATVLEGVEVVGVDPNPEMQPYAHETAELVFQQPGDSLRLVTGSAEALPLPDDSVDAAVCTLVLCSVKQPDQVLNEILRVLRPKGCFAFLEHVYAPSDRPLLRVAQTVLNPLQQVLADECHLTRDTLRAVETAGFAQVDADRFVVGGLSYLGPHVAGVAIK